MRLRFRNRYTHQLWVAVMSYDPGGCGGHGDWRCRGWWAINPGGEAYVLDTGNRYAAYYAEAGNGAIWSGTYGPMPVTQAAFNHCLDAAGQRRVGAKLVDMNNYSDYYVNLVA